MMRRRLLTTLALGALAGAAIPAEAQVYPERIRSLTRRVEAVGRVERYQGNQRETQTEPITKTARLGASGELVVSNISGDIVVTRGRGSDVTIEAVKTGRGRTAEEAKGALQLIEVDIVERGGRLEIRARYPRQADSERRNWRGFSGGVDFTIAAPQDAQVRANSISGDISVTDIRGELSLETVSGDVRIANAGRVAQAKTASGDVEITDTTIETALDAATISGDMILRNVKARRLDVGSVSGDVILENVQSERIDAQSLSGGIRLSGPLVRGGRYDLGSHSGEVHVQVSGDVGFEIDASSFSGSIRSDIDLKTTAEPASRGRRRSLHATYGDGSAFLDITTFSGRIVITR